MTEFAPLLLHASCVAVKGRGLLITGPSGVGKSALALQMMALGADLVADDQTVLQPRAGKLFGAAPQATAGLIEARFLGILKAPHLAETEIALVIDLSHQETERLPPCHKITLAGVSCALAYFCATPHLPASLMCWLAHGRHA